MAVNRLFSIFHLASLKIFSCRSTSVYLVGTSTSTFACFYHRTAPIDTSRIGWFHNLDWHLKVEKSSRVIELYFKRSSMNAEENKPLSLWRQHIIISYFNRHDLTHRINIRLGASKYTNPMKLSFWNPSNINALRC